MTRPPKQWKHWCKKAGLRQVFRLRHQHAWYTMEGYGRVWRVNCHDMLQCGDRIEDFDRWALCSPIVEVPVPRSLTEFQWAVVALLAAQALKEAQ